MHKVAFVRQQQSNFDKWPLIYCHVCEIKVQHLQAVHWARPEERVKVSTAPPPPPTHQPTELDFTSLETSAPTSSWALRVNQRHKGYDVRLVTNDDMMCTETTWQFAAINLGAWHGPFFFPEEDGSDSTQDKTLFLPAYSALLILALEKKR